MNEIESSKAKEKKFSNSLPSLPWIPVVNLPKMNFRRPKIELPHNAPHKYIAAFLVLFSSFLLAGGIYDLAESNVLPLGFTQQGYQPIYPGLNDQFIVESFTILVFIILGTMGIYLLRQATYAAREGQPASFMLILGIGLITLGVLAAIIMLNFKIGKVF
ncbi:MAG: hypothetical protein ACFFD1_12500 [Candidatus Thorarchaeota archaeon]